MLLFGTVDNPFSPEVISEKYLYINRLFSKKQNAHLVELLGYLNSTKYNSWKISSIEAVDTAFGETDNLASSNKEAIYRNYKLYLLEDRKIDRDKIETLWNLKTLLVIDNETEKKHRELNYQLFDVLAQKIMDDMIITEEEIAISDKLCEYLSLPNSEFVSILQNKSSAIMSSFMSVNSFENISSGDISKIQNYYEFLNRKGLKYDVNLPLHFLNNYNLYCSKNKIDLAGIKLNVGFPTMINYPLYGAYDGKVAKMKKTKGQSSYELASARIYNYLAGFTIAYKYNFVDGYTGTFDTIISSQVKEYSDRIFSNTGEKYLAILKQGERNPFAFAELKEEEYEIIKAAIQFTRRGLNMPTVEETRSRPDDTETNTFNIKNESARKPQSDEKREDEKETHVEDYIEELNKLIGIEEVKNQIKSLVNYIKFQKLRSAKELKTTPITLHSIFSGAPGTGKTTVARLYGGILKQVGMLKKGHLIEVDRSGLVAGYLGQTAIKVEEVVNRSMDGVLFIDEAYSLTSSENDSFGEEAVNILLKKMEDNRDRLVIILAGYSTEMARFIDSNPGLKSRFTRYINFTNYSAGELFNIFELQCKENQYCLTEDAGNYLKNHFRQVLNSDTKNFGNGRYVRNLFERIVERHSNRVVNLLDPKDEDITTFNLIDVSVTDAV